MQCDCISILYNSKDNRFTNVVICAISHVSLRSLWHYIVFHFYLQVRIIAVQALTTIAIRSGEPYRLQIYELLHTLAQGGVQSQFSDMHISNGEDQGASGTGLGSLISPMLKVLDEMYSAQDDLIK